MAFDIDRLPAEFREDVRIAVKTLTAHGAMEVYLFGSIVRGSEQIRDIDIAVRGIAPSRFFRVYGRLMMMLDHEFDLINLDTGGRFVTRLQESGSLERVA